MLGIDTQALSRKNKSTQMRSYVCFECVHHPEGGDDRVDVVRESPAVQLDLDPVLGDEAALLPRVARIGGATGVAAQRQRAPQKEGIITCSHSTHLDSTSIKK